MSSTILIVEDDAVFRRVLSFTVGKTGLNVETASNGELGYQRLKQGGIDFLVTDLQMPICTGVELLTRLQDEGFDRPPTILCTAKGLELDTEMLKNKFSLTAILHKPFSPRNLSELVVSSMEPVSPSVAPTFATGAAVNTECYHG